MSKLLKSIKLSLKDLFDYLNLNLLTNFFIVPELLMLKCETI